MKKDLIENFVWAELGIKKILVDVGGELMPIERMLTEGIHEDLLVIVIGSSSLDRRFE